MKLSIIIPVYNSEEFLSSCLDSIVNQNGIDYELILVNDGSTDNSLNICKEYERRFPSITVLSQENSGPSAARNAGIQAASGDYLLFVDSDDRIHPSYMSVLHEVMESKHPDIIFFGSVHAKNGTEITRVFPSGEIRGHSAAVTFLSDHYYCGDVCSSVNKAYAHRLFDDGELFYPVGTVVEEDLQFVLNALDRCQLLVSIPDALYYYNRRDSGSVTTKYNPIKFDCKVQAYQYEIQISQKWGNQHLIDIFQDNYLSYISSSINNLLYSTCPLSKKEKIAQIIRFYNAPSTKSCISRSFPISTRSRLMKFLIQFRLYRTSYYLHKIIFKLKGR